MSRHSVHTREGRRRGRSAAVLAAVGVGLAGAAGAAQAATPPGRADTSFGSQGTATAPVGVNLAASTVLPDGRVVAVGQDARHGNVLALVRFTARGALDSSFGSGGVVDGPTPPGGAGGTTQGAAIAQQPDGKLVVVGTSQAGYGAAILIERFNSNGSPDSGFGSGGVAQALGGTLLGDGRAVAIQGDGKILAGGSASVYGSGNGSYPRVALVRLNANGSPDGSFGTGGTDVIDLGPYSEASGVAAQSDGKIVLAGSQSGNLQSTNALVARVTGQGALDTSFAGGHGAIVQQYSIGGASSQFNAVAIQPNGSIVAGGSAFNGGSAAVGLLARFTSGGGADGSFGAGGVARVPSAANYISGSSGVPGINALALPANGNIIAAGFAANQSLTVGGVWSFNSHGGLDTSFGAGGFTAVNPPGGESNGETGVALGPDGSIVATGEDRNGFGPLAGTVSRLTGYVTAPPVPNLKISLQKLVRSIKLSALSRHGLGVTVTCNRGCKVKLTLTVSARTAKTLKLRVSHNRPVTLTSTSRTLSGAGSHSFTLKLSRSLLKALGRQRKVSVSLLVSVTPTPSGRAVSQTKTITVTR